MKKGDKYVIEIAEVHTHFDDKNRPYAVGRVKGFNSLFLDNYATSRLQEAEDNDYAKAFDLAVNKILSLEDTIDAIVFGEDKVYDTYFRKEYLKQRLLSEANGEKLTEEDMDDIFSEQTENIFGEHRE